MAKPARTDTYLIAVKQKRQPTQLYALSARSPAAALAIVSGQAIEGFDVEIAGKLSRRLARPYKLKLGVPVLI